MKALDGAIFMDAEDGFHRIDFVASYVTIKVVAAQEVYDLLVPILELRRGIRRQLGLFRRLCARRPRRPRLLRRRASFCAAHRSVRVVLLHLDVRYIQNQTTKHAKLHAPSC